MSKQFYSALWQFSAQMALSKNSGA